MLQTALKHYEEAILPYFWHFTYQDQTTRILAFTKTDLMHLLGLHEHKTYANLKKGNIPRVSTICYNDIKTGKLTNDRTIKDHKAAYITPRIQHFTNLESILLDASTEHYTYDRTINNSKIQADFLLYNHKSGLHLHLLQVDGNTHKGILHCSPMSWFSHTTGSPDHYTKGQTRKQLHEVKKELKVKPKAPLEP